MRTAKARFPLSPLAVAHTVAVGAATKFSA
jgi:hypothetical protein